MKKLSGILVLAMLFMLAIPTMIYADEHEEPGTITDIVVAATEADDPEFNILKDALVEAGLDTTLARDDVEFTVFAPTDAAFEALFQELGIEAADLLAHPQLTDVLLYHVAEGVKMSGDLSDGQMIETEQGESLEIAIDNDVVEVEQATVIDADIEASNGVIHVIDAVLIPEAFILLDEDPGTITDVVVGLADADEEFTILKAALVEADLTDALAGEGPFTVFAPTDAAFEALLEALDIEAADLLGHPQLADVLLYHVVSGTEYMSTDLVDGQEIETMQGESVEITILLAPMVDDAEVILADVEASNGVIHVIDTVLIPEAFDLAADEEPPAEDEDIPPTGDTSSVLPAIALLILSLGLLTLLGRTWFKQRK